ncbi:hypothetical protein AHAS_Ahas06G0118300 [Arachis hypogaea]
MISYFKILRLIIFGIACLVLRYLLYGTSEISLSLMENRFMSPRPLTKLELDPKSSSEFLVAI